MVVVKANRFGLVSAVGSVFSALFALVFGLTTDVSAASTLLSVAWTEFLLDFAVGCGSRSKWGDVFVGFLCGIFVLLLFSSYLASDLAFVGFCCKLSAFGLAVLTLSFSFFSFFVLAC